MRKGRRKGRGGREEAIEGLGGKESKQKEDTRKGEEEKKKDKVTCTCSFQS